MDSTSIYHNLVITDLADENAVLRERVANLEQNVTWYRAMVHWLLGALAGLREPRRLRDELAALREQVMREDAATSKTRAA